MQASALHSSPLSRPWLRGKPRLLGADDGGWDRFVAEAAVPTFLQTAAWAEVKRSNGWRASRIVAEAGGRSIGAQLLVRRAGPLPFGFGYAARGPISPEPIDAAMLAAFTEAVRAEAGGHGASYVRIDPELEDLDGSVAATLRALGWQPAHEVQPARTRVLDLAQDEGEIWQGIHRKWRQSIRKGGRDGNRVVPADIARLDEFHAIHVETMRRVGLPARSASSFRALYTAFDRGGHARLLFAETPDGAATASILLLGWGNRVVDLYGGTTVLGRRLRSNYFIKWEAILRAKAAGYTAYDLWGLPSDAVNQFKSGWGGRELHYVGAWDLVVNPIGRFAFEAAIRGRSRLLRLRGRHAAADLDVA